MRDVEKLVRRGILAIEPYTPGKPIEEVQAELGLERVVKLASNENPLGPSPKALAAIRNELEQLHVYPEGPCTALRQAVARRLQIAEDMITFSNGSDNCILLLGQAFINEGDEIIMADPTFLLYETVARLMRARSFHVKLKHGLHDLDGMLRKVSGKTKLLFICNPNNPTGTIVARDELDDFVAALPDHTILVLDEAYAEFVSDRKCAKGLRYIKEGHNVVALRTFSKMYGLAGLRVGYALGRREIIAALNRVREPFPVSRLAQAGALAALDDDTFGQKVLKNNEMGKAYLYGEFDKMGLDYFRTQSNFIFVNFKQDSRRLFESLLRKGIIIRPGYLWDYSTWGRVTIGTMEENRAFIRALRETFGS
jgi:histidinol-phosphate aminotransferase